MSSYVLSPYQINLIVGAITSSPSPIDGKPYVPYFLKILGSPDYIGKLLYNMNMDAVAYRYPDLDYDDLPGEFIVREDYRYEPSVFVTWSLRAWLRIYEVLKLYLYQCNEGHIPETALYKAVEKFYNNLAHYLINNYIKSKEERRPFFER